MEKSVDRVSLGGMVERRLAQLKVVSRLLNHEVEIASGEKNVNLDMDLARSILTTLELFIEDAEGAQRASTGPVQVDKGDKAKVTRLN